MQKEFEHANPTKRGRTEKKPARDRCGNPKKARGRMNGRAVQAIMRRTQGGRQWMARRSSAQGSDSGEGREDKGGGKDGEERPSEADIWNDVG